MNPATAWQPRGGEVLIAASGDSTKFSNLSFLACFGWNDRQAANYFTADSLGGVAWEPGFVAVRPTVQTGILNLGVTVPPLRSAPSNFWQRWGTGIRSKGFGLVPVADLRLIAYTKDGVLFDEVRPIGITSVLYALCFTAICLAFAIAILHRLAVGESGRDKAATLRDQIGKLASVGNLKWILTLVSTDGRASLSAFQILLWTLVVASSGMYVMALSGNLINITSGTLTLLGIAGAAGLIAAYTDATAKTDNAKSEAAAGKTEDAAGKTDAAAGKTQDASGPLEGTNSPAWQDLVLDPITRQPDISRAQMLLFTVISAAFVLVQVLNYYVIPDIPAGYQILIGISNGLYVGRKVTPTKTA